MKHVLEVCVVTFVVMVSGINLALAQSRPDIPMRKGISVEMPIAAHAVLVPDADEEDAFVVVVNEGGALFLGAEPITPTTLSAAVHPGNAVYLKADARAPYRSVLQAVDALRTAGVRACTLLATQQRESPAARPQFPEGIEVWFAYTRSGSSSVSVQLLESNQQSPMLKIDGGQVAWTSLAASLGQALDKAEGKSILISAAGEEHFEDVVHIVDVGVGLGAKVYVTN